MDHIADIISSKGYGKVWFTSIDLKYAYGQLLLALATARQCNFSLVRGAATGTYRFLTGFYGLADMPAVFQQAIDRVLTGTQVTNAVIDDILVCTKGTLAEHLQEVKHVLAELDATNVGLNLRKCKFAQSEVDWLGYKLIQEGVTPLRSKLKASSNFKRLKH